MRRENEESQKCVTTRATGTQPCWGALGEGTEQNSEYLGREETGCLSSRSYLLLLKAVPRALTPWRFCRWARRMPLGREEQVLALGCKRYVLKDECERDIGGAVIASVMFNNSCVVRLNYFLRLELGAFRSGNILLWGHDYHEGYKCSSYFNTSQPSYLCGDFLPSSPLLGPYTHLWLPWVLAANGLQLPPSLEDCTWLMGSHLAQGS